MALLSPEEHHYLKLVWNAPDDHLMEEIPFEGRLIDMTLLSSKRNFNKLDDLENFSFVTNNGENITLSQVADLEIVGLPNQIKRLSGKRVLSIQLRPNEDISLEESIKVLNDKLIKPLNDKLPKGVFVNISGAASELKEHGIACSKMS